MARLSWSNDDGVYGEMAILTSIWCGKRKPFQLCVIYRRLYITKCSFGLISFVLLRHNRGRMNIVFKSFIWPSGCTCVVRLAAGRWLPFNTHFAWRDVCTLSRGIWSETCRKYSSCEWALLERFQGQETKVEVITRSFNLQWRSIHFDDVTSRITFFKKSYEMDRPITR